MPGILLHYLCGDTVLGMLEDTSAAALLQMHRQPFNLGTQGPDILFYHRAWPWKKSEGIKEVGESLHDKGAGAFFESALRYITGSENKERDTLTAYLCGFACHYSLDLHTHPYIFYKTGFVRKDEPDNKQFSFYHRTFETALDVLMLERLKGTSPSRINASSLIRVTDEEAGSIAGLYQKAIPDALKVSIRPQQVCEAISDMVSITHALTDRTGRKKKLLTALEKRLSPYPLMASMIHPVSVADRLDHLNLQKEAWKLPWDASVIMTNSFIELYEEAASEAKALCNAIYSCIYEGAELADTLKLLGNRSFSSGIDCETDIEFRHYSCIY